jgi:hypothetical protein
MDAFRAVTPNRSQSGRRPARLPADYKTSQINVKGNLFSSSRALDSCEGNMANSASTRLNFIGLGESDAERLLAVIWRVLEERDLPTPHVDIRSGNPSLDITLTFRSAEECATIKEHLSSILRST